MAYIELTHVNCQAVHSPTEAVKAMQVRGKLVVRFQPIVEQDSEKQVSKVMIDEALGNILSSLGFTEYGVILREAGCTDELDFAMLSSPDAFPSAIPFPAREKLAAHARSVAILRQKQLKERIQTGKGSSVHKAGKTKTVDLQEQGPPASASRQLFGPFRVQPLAIWLC